MFRHRLDQIPNNRVIFHWYLLSFNSGLINSGGFLATGRFVSHVTGFATLFGVDVARSHLRPGIGILSVPLFFLLGAFLAGMMIDRPIHRGRKPHFDYVMGLSALCLFLAACGELAHFGDFGGGLQLRQTYVLLSTLCLACGLQNGAITSSSGSSIRTTHLTGLMTDLGLGIARLLTFDRQHETFRQEAHASLMRINSIISFAIGSAFGAWFFIKLGYLGFIIPGLIASYASFHGRKAKIAAHRWEIPVGGVA